MIRIDLLFPTPYSRTLAYLAFIVALFAAGIDIVAPAAAGLTMGGLVCAAAISARDDDDYEVLRALKFANKMAAAAAAKAREDAFDAARDEFEEEIDAATYQLVGALSRTHDAMQRGDLKAARWELERALEAA